MSGAEPRRIEIPDLLSPERILVGLVAGDKNRVLSEIARIAAADTGIGAPVILAALTERERLGSTGVGGGIAMPHAELPGLRGFRGYFVRLDRKIDFDAIDGAKVDLLFAILIPPAAPDRVAALSCAARRLREAAVTAQIRRAATPAEVFELLWRGASAA